MAFNYSFELFEFSEALSPYGTIDTKPPEKTTFEINNFVDGNHFRTGTDSEGHLQLALDDRIITLVLDNSGSQTWNDAKADRYVYLRRLLTRLNATYPAALTTNLITFGGSPIQTRMLATSFATTADNLTTHLILKSY